MAVAKIKIRIKKSLLFLGSIFVLFTSLSQVASAQNSTVTATLCDMQGPDIVLNTPVSDSVTDLAVIPIQGTAERTSQVDIYRNGQYDQSLSVGESNPQISTTISLSEGTNTIRFEAFYSCNQTTASLTRIVTYKPSATGSNPSNTDTEVTKPGNTQPNIVSNPVKTPEEPTFIEQIIDGLRENFGFKKGVDQSFVKPIASWIALLLSVVALFAVFAPIYFIGMATRLLGWKPHAKSSRLRFIIRIIAGVLLALFTLFIAA